MTAAHFSLDIETLDTRPSAVILSVGICKFDMERGVTASAHYAFCIEEQLLMKRTINDATFWWWVEQLVKMKENPFPGEDDRWDVAGVLSKLQDFIFTHGHNTIMNPDGRNIIWVRGPHFDWSILEGLRDAAKLRYSPSHPARPLPDALTRYNNIRDQRTLQQLAPEVEGVPNPLPHCAVEDAIAQAYDIINLHDALGRELDGQTTRNTDAATS